MKRVKSTAEEKAAVAKLRASGYTVHVKRTFDPLGLSPTAVLVFTAKRQGLRFAVVEIERWRANAIPRLVAQIEKAGVQR